MEETDHTESMAEKISTLIVKVDLDCHQCYKKIRKILCKLQDQERIRTISYDDKSSTITIVGPFDPHKLSCKIRCKGGKVIKDIRIMDGDKPEKMAEPPPPINNGKQKRKEKPKEKPVAEPPPAAQPASPDREISALVPAIIEQEKQEERPAELEQPMEKPADLPVVEPVEKEKPRERPPPPAWKPDPPPDVTPMVEIPSWPAPPPVVGPARPCGCSCCTPCYQGYYEGCRCCHCGRVYGYAVGVAGPTPPAGCYGGAGAPYCGAYRGCQLFSEEDPTAACIIM